MENYNTFEALEMDNAVACTPSDKKKIIARLVVVGLTFLAGLILSIVAMFTTASTFFDGIRSFLIGMGTTLCVAPLLWGFTKWWNFMWPRSKRIANKVWSLTIPLTLLALAVKVMVWIWMALMPVMLYFVILSPLILLLSVLATLPCQWLMEILFFLVCAAIMGFMLLLDIGKLRGQSWKEVLRKK